MSTSANNAGARSANEDNEEPSPNPNLHWSVRRLNLIAKGLNSGRYLEIGVHRGLTFRNVAIPERVGVDPHFDSDVLEIADQRTSLFKVTSDSYFENLAADEVFDLIFIDGLHTFEQTYRDLCGCLLHSHARTVFLIDDTKPDDVYSSMRNHSRALKYRRSSGGQGNSWHGDTFKVVFAIHDFHFGLNYRTISGSGNSQTVVWRSIAGPRKPRLNSMETISRLDYFDLMDEIDVLRECCEREAIDLCLTELGMQDQNA